MENKSSKKKLIAVIILAVTEVIAIVFLMSLALFSMWSTTSKDKTLVKPFGDTLIVTAKTSDMGKTYSKNDLLFFNIYDSGKDTIKENDIICFYTIIEGKQTLKTTRVYQVSTVESTTVYRIKDDNDDRVSGMYLTDSDILGTYTHIRLIGYGAMVESLVSSSGLFFGVVIIPLAVIFLADALIMLKLFIDRKSETETEEASNDGVLEDSQEKVEKIEK